MALQPYYTLQNVTAAYQLNWSVDLFWKSAIADNSWLPHLSAVIQPDGIHLLEHRFLRPDISQILISTQPHLAPQNFIKIIKGRLQYLLRENHPKAFMRYSPVSREKNGFFKVALMPLLVGQDAGQFVAWGYPRPRTDQVVRMG
ncbi:MAG: hypothetical protein NTX50_26885, partial [Candidatus Sumerlaeota bacterium]|nr:hypothetical protein [Candidatus Sumerlaeota bacterium]